MCLFYNLLFSLLKHGQQMKKALLSLVFLATLAGCRKSDEIQPPADHKTNCMGATFYADHYADNTYRVKIATYTTHFCQVCDELLESYKRYPRESIVCPGEPVKMRLVLAPDQCKKPN